jgi:hypothetical protein
VAAVPKVPPHKLKKYCIKGSVTLATEWFSTCFTSIVTMLQAWWFQSSVQFLSGVEIFSSLHCPVQLWRLSNLLFGTWCLIKHMDNFTLQMNH